jgi:hypothetical protein
VGEAIAGEWVERGISALHLRRRLAGAEARSVGPVLDVRGTAEQHARLARLQPVLRGPLRGLSLEALIGLG